MLKIKRIIDYIMKNIPTYIVTLWILLLPFVTLENYKTNTVNFTLINIILIIILLITYLYDVIKNKFDINIYDITAYILLQLNLLSTIFAVKEDTAWAGFIRQNGFFTITFYIILILTLKRTLTKKNTKIILSSIIINGIINVVYASLQLFTNLNFIYRFDKPYMASALLTNPNYLGSLMSLLLALTISLLTLKDNHQIIYSILSFIFLLGLIFAQSTGPLVGLIIALILLLIIIIVRYRKKLKKYLIILCALTLCFCAVERTCRIYYQYKGYTLDERYTIVGGLEDIYKFIGKYIFGKTYPKEEEMGNGRIWIWKNSIPLLSKYPLLGCGPDNFVHVFPQTKPKVIFVEAHNIYLNYAINNGLIAASIYIIFLIYIIYEAIRVNNKTITILLIGYISFIVQAIFSVSIIQVQTLFYAYLAVLLALIKLLDKEKYDIAIYGYYGFQNKGDDFVLNQIINNLLKEDENLKICVLTGKNYEKVKKQVTYKRRNLFNTIIAIKESKYFLTGGGSLLQDKTSNKSFYYYLLILKIATNYNKKIIMYSNGIGPLKNKNIELLKKANLNIHLATLRDKKSYQLLKQIYKDTKIYQTKDEMLTYDYQANDVKTEDYIVVSMKNEPKKKDNIVNLFDDILTIANKEKLKIFILIMDNYKDLKLNKYLSNHNNIEIYNQNDIDSILNLLKNAKGVISMRLHLLILSSLAGISPLAISTNDYKIDEFMKDINSKHIYNLDKITKENIIAYLNDNKKVSIDMLKNKARENIELTIKEIKNG